MSASAVHAGVLHRVRRVPTVDGFSIAVGASGADKDPAVVIFAKRRGFGAYDAVCRRLHLARFRTAVIEFHPRLDTKSVIGVLGAFGIPWALLVADGAGGELAWTLAATRPERFKGLVAINCGHPCVPDVTGVVVDDRCPPVEINTTMLVDTSAPPAVAHATSRHVYGEFRVAQLVDGGDVQYSSAQVAAEIVLRAYSW
jgi:pimeloyl-ACP methyl ester carboxylesterase